MNATFEQLREIFLAAVEQGSPAQRDRYLDQACGGDPRLRQQVAALLKAHEAEGSLLDGCSAGTQATALFGPAPEASGTVIGPYKLIEPIGEGGMGTVYMAEQSRPVRRQVALKVIKPGMDTRQVVARFEAERQALAMMDHPNIAKVHDGGTTESGRPYFVMELVDGIPITDYCDRERLSIPQRLELFVLVCRAVQHAHQKGIIHRDLKPSNVMITVIDGVAVPKVIDFGVAKATGDPFGDQTLLTGLTQFLGTPRYMSPEQAGLTGSDIDTRSDIYSLGVLLYELLTGTTPFDSETFRNAALGEIQRIIREDEPPTPSTRLSELGATLTDVSAHRQSDARRLRSAVRGELDWIVMKALEKDRARRYETANDFAADVMRHLNNQPVEACPPSAGYRLRKYARRNRVFISTATLVLLTLIMGTLISTWQAIQAREAERKSRWELSLQEILRILSSPPVVGWSKAVEQRVGEAARLGPDEDRRLQGYAAASLGGLDARRIKTIPLAATALAFDPSGKDLFLCDTAGQTWVWDGSANPHRKVGAPGPGIFAFKPNGTAVQLLSATKEKPAEIELRAVDPARPLHRFVSPLGPGSRIDAITLTPDAAHVAATILTEKDKAFAVVWNGETGNLVRQVEIDRPTALSLSPDGHWLAVGTKDGEVAVWPLPKGDPLPRFTLGRVAIATLAFAPDRLRRAGPTRLDAAWLLAVGDVATRLAVFELATHAVRSRFRGSNYEVGIAAFSPDGMLLASAGRRWPVLWNIATGHPVLQLDDFTTVTSIGFSPDGTRIAVSGQDSLGHPNALCVYTLENGRGLQRLWGLDSQIDKIAFSADGRLVAALAQDFRIGIWDRSRARLLHVLEVPTGVFTDNAGLAFRPDGKAFAYACGTRAMVWAVETGAVVASWTLPEGFQDNLAYASPDRLISTRVETTEPNTPPYGTDPETYPRVLRIRSLDAEGARLLSEVRDFNLHVFYSELTRDGRSLMIEGRSGPSREPVRLVKAFDVAGNSELWTFQGTHPEIDAAPFHFDPTGRVFIREDPEDRVHLLEFPSRTLLETYGVDDASNIMCCLSPGGQLRLSFGGAGLGPYRVRLLAPRQELLMIMDFDSIGGAGCQFSLDGRIALWGNRDGTVTVFEPAEVQRRLARFRMGW